MAKKNDKNAEPWQIGGAAIGTALGALLGFLTSLFFLQISPLGLKNMV